MKIVNNNNSNMKTLSESLKRNKNTNYEFFFLRKLCLKNFGVDSGLLGWLILNEHCFS